MSLTQEGRERDSTDGLTILWSDMRTSRPGGKGFADLWMATRRSTEEAFGPARNLGPPVNTAVNDGLPSLSGDWPRPGAKLYFGRCLGSCDGTELYEATWVPRRSP